MPDGGSLDRLLKEIRACRQCMDNPTGKALPHKPRPVVVASKDAEILIAGQAPGTRVHASGITFDDPSGDRLRNWLGVDRTQFYDPRNFAIVPMGFCFPGLDAKGGDLPPRRECAPLWRTRLLAELPRIRLILIIGQYAQEWHLGNRRAKTLTDTVRNWRSYFDAVDDGPRMLVLPHPSWRNSGWLGKNPWFEADVLPALRKEIARRVKHA